MMVDEENPVIEFTAETRCDRCGAQAFMIAENKEFGELFFCRHHARECKNSLVDEGWKITIDGEGISKLTDRYPAPLL